MPTDPKTASTWMTRSVVAIAFASLFSDACYELIIPLLPSFITSLGGGPFVLGLMEGLADGIAFHLNLRSAGRSDVQNSDGSGYLGVGVFMPAIALMHSVGVSRSGERRAARFSKPNTRYVARRRHGPALGRPGGRLPAHSTRWALSSSRRRDRPDRDRLAGATRSSRAWVCSRIDVSFVRGRARSRCASRDSRLRLAPSSAIPPAGVSERATSGDAGSSPPALTRHVGSARRHV
jgi:hypothetical protein